MSRREDAIVVYGKVDCADTVSVRVALESMRLPYEWRDVARHPELAEEAMVLNGGVDRWPTVVVPGPAVLVEPSTEQLRSHLISES